MVLIVGIASTAAGAFALYRKVEGGAFGDPQMVIRRIRQTTGLLLAVAHFVRSALDALQLISRPVATATTGGSMRPVIGRPAGDE